jgi:hypothetical protein
MIDFKTLLPLKAAATAVGLGFLLFAASALAADPPSRVARLGYLSGAVSVAPAGGDEWIEAGINRPLTTGDRVWVEPGARAELQVGGAMLRLAAGTAIALLDVGDGVAQVQLSQGSLNLRVRRLERGQVYEIATPNLAFTVSQPGVYRIDVDPVDDATTVTVRSGRGEVVAGNEAFTIDARQPYRFTGDGLREYGAVDAGGLDEFDRWSSARDRAEDTSVSARYVSRDVVGYQDLDAHGSWHVDVNIGPVWMPNRVSAGWSPYSEGHWLWVDPWGWTWVDDAPWGFAVSHYGRWTQTRAGWGWVPGPLTARPYYAPALVVFIGGDNFRITLSSGAVSGVGWFPLAPREVYRPSYPVSRSYYDQLNRSNTVVNTTIINNTYNNTTINVGSFANHKVKGAVIAVPKTAFVQSQPVARVAQRPAREVAVNEALAFAPAVVPTASSVRGGADQRERPPAKVFDKPVVVRKAPPAPAPSLAQQLPRLATQPGKPLDERTRREIAPPAAAVERAPAVRVATPPKDTPKVMPARPPERAADKAPDRSPDRSPEKASTKPAKAVPKREVEPAPRTEPQAPSTGRVQREKSQPTPPAVRQSAPPEARTPASRPTTGKPDVPKKNAKDDKDAKDDAADAKRQRDPRRPD